MNCEGIAINSNLVSYQNRPRIFWSNIPDITIPEDRNINFQDYKETNAEICREYKVKPTPSRIKMWNNGGVEIILEVVAAIKQMQQRLIV
jgi:DNA (cytosine-5)-methyltransferase 3A